MKVVAQQGSDRFLVDLGDQIGCIVDARLGRAWPPHSLLSCSKGGYWEDVRLPVAEQESVVALVAANLAIWAAEGAHRSNPLRAE